MPPAAPGAPRLPSVRDIPDRRRCRTEPQQSAQAVVTTPSRAIVQSAGDVLLIRAQDLEEEFRRGEPLQRLLLRYVRALVTQIAQTAVCNRHHNIDQQLCRWLLSVSIV
jgi:hypothetical protein